MRMNRFLFLGVLCAIPLLAADPFLGTWKFNPQKSKVDNPSNFKNHRQIIEAVGPNSQRITNTADGPDGKERKTVQIIVSDGKEYTSSSGAVMTSERVDEHHIKLTLKKDDRSQTVDASISDDGKTMSLHYTGQGLGTGRSLDEIEVFDRE
jgi:hypothetical protein